ncbi:hypothetical protein LZ32DRAFT_120909 [Colletotrichum eremochloae]|nr:hypothetical protein LZ32DRAFT_120909 [Colletotrichum eremochloae]
MCPSGSSLFSICHPPFPLFSLFFAALGNRHDSTLVSRLVLQHVITVSGLAGRHLFSKDSAVRPCTFLFLSLLSVGI